MSDLYPWKLLSIKRTHKNDVSVRETESNFTQNFLVGIENQDGTDGTLAYNQTLWYKNRGAIEFVPSVALCYIPAIL